MSLSSILSFLQSYGFILIPVGAWLAGVVVRHMPGNRYAQLKVMALHVVQSAEQQANDRWPNEYKYNAAAQGLSLLAARFGYRVNQAEVKLLIEGAVAEFKSLKSSTSVVPSFPPAGVASMGSDVSSSSSSDSPTPTDAAAAGAV